MGAKSASGHVKGVVHGYQSLLLYLYRMLRANRVGEII